MNVLEKANVGQESSVRSSAWIYWLTELRICRNAIQIFLEVLKTHTTWSWC